MAARVWNHHLTRKLCCIKCQKLSLISFYLFYRFVTRFFTEAAPSVLNSTAFRSLLDINTLLNRYASVTWLCITKCPSVLSPSPPLKASEATLPWSDRMARVRLHSSALVAQESCSSSESSRRWRWTGELYTHHYFDELCKGIFYLYCLP